MLLFVSACCLFAGAGLFHLANSIRTQHDPERGRMARSVVASLIGGPILFAIGLGLLGVLGSFVTR